MNEKIMKQEATYDWLKDEVHCLYDEKKELQERIDKAIEYITKYWISYEDIEKINDLREELDIPIEDIKELLDILKGGDSND